MEGTLADKIRITGLESENTELRGNIVDMEKRFEKQIQKHEKEKIELYARIEELQVNQINRNPFGAGRKSKATPENIAEILRLRSENMSFGRIAKALQEKSGTYICKSTVKKIYDANR